MEIPVTDGISFRIVWQFEGFCVNLQAEKVRLDGTTLEQELLQGDGSELLAVFCVLCADTTVTALSE